MKTKEGLRAIALAVALSAATGTAAAGEGEGGKWKAADSLVGAWRVTITPYECTSGRQSPQFAFRSLLTFASGGTMSETTTNQTFQPGQRGPGHGSWERTGPNYYHSVFEAFINYTVSPPLPPPTPPYQRGSQRLEQDIRMIDQDRWTSLADVYFFDEGGTQWRLPGCAKAEAERIR
jgi:hypothetical protein